MWQPTASLHTLQQRARLLEATRLFFKARNVLEVDTPILGKAPVSDPFLSALQTEIAAFPQQTFYLQTSPEYYLKRLIAQYSIACYHLGKCFRDDEYGRHHSPEFLMLEYYRPGFDDFMLMQEVSELIQTLLKAVTDQENISDLTDSSKGFFGRCISYRQVFQETLQIDPHQVSESVLQDSVKKKIGEIVGVKHPDRDTCLQLLMSEIIEPELAKIAEPVFIYDFPATQAALARIKTLEDGTQVAARFEVYWHGVELGNAYYELASAEEQKLRFDSDLQKRKQLGLPAVPVDTNLLAALEYGIPECAGIAIGFDRLVMILLNQQSLADVQSFFEF